jgi:hypothetical protein
MYQHIYWPSKAVFLKQWDFMVGWVGHEISKIIIINLATQNSPTAHKNLLHSKHMLVINVAP